MMSTDIPLVRSIVVIAIFVGLQRLLGYLTLNNDAVESFIESKSELLVENGRINLPQLKREFLSENELYELIRGEGISHLGQIRVAFLEPHEHLSIIRRESPNEAIPRFNAEAIFVSNGSV